MTQGNSTPHFARFNGLSRLYSPEGLDKISRSHVCVIGLGGVGSWAVEALARSGVGKLTLVDLDDICVGNTNRQLHALETEFGKPKVDVMARRIRSINPGCNVHPVHSFFLKSNASEILQTHFDFVLDAIDSPARHAATGGDAACRRYFSRPKTTERTNCYRRSRLFLNRSFPKMRGAMRNH